VLLTPHFKNSESICPLTGVMSRFGITCKKHGGSE
jgi:hypothetical protein